MNKKTALSFGTITLLVIEAVVSVILFAPKNRKIDDVVPRSEFVEQPSQSIPTPKLKLAKEPPGSYEVPINYHVFQTFNNCGPATLAMAFNYWGVASDQETLGWEIRPNQNPQGIIDDKSMMAYEFITFSEKYGLTAVVRPNGSLDLLKKLIANDIPVIVRTWLHPNEDIGHFRIIRGYNENQILQNDSYEGPNLYYDNQTFLSMWKPFNFGYIIVYPKEKQELVEEILGEELDEKIAWKNSLNRAQNESGVYSLFNQSVANYHLGNYQEAVTLFEQAEPNLPSRMLWYQLEPILAYQKVGNSERVFSLTNNILNSGNGGFAELYQIRGEVYRTLGQRDLAREEFNRAYFYNSNLVSAREPAEEPGS